MKAIPLVSAKELQLKTKFADSVNKIIKLWIQNEITRHHHESAIMAHCVTAFHMGWSDVGFLIQDQVKELMQYRKPNYIDLEKLKCNTTQEQSTS